MAGTTSRVGIDITARDRSRAAFSSIDRSLAALNRTVRVIKGGLAGFVGGNLLANVVRSLVEINRASEPVSTAINQMQRAWQAFALKVGEAGLNQGLIEFSKRMGALLLGTDGLSQAIGRFLGGGARLLASLFEGIGRAIGFAYDNGRTLIQVFAVMAAMNIAVRIVAAARSFVLLVTALKAASLASALFHLVSRRALVVWAGAAAIFASATGTLDDLQQAMGWVWQQAELLIPTIDGGVAAALKRMGFDVNSLTADLGAFEGKLAGLPPLFEDIATAKDKLGKPIDIVPKGFDSGVQKLTEMQQAAIDVGDVFKSWVTDLRAGTKMLDAARNALDALATKFLDQAFAFLLPSQAPGGGFNAGGILSALQGFSGFFAKGGTLGAGQWGFAGEDGIEVVRGPANIAPVGNGRGRTIVNVSSYGGGEPSVSRRRQGADEIIDVVLKATDARFGNNLMKHAPLINQKPASKRTT